MPNLTRISFLVEIDIESPPSDYMLRSYVEEGIKKALAPKKLKHGKVYVWPRQLNEVERTALALAEAIINQTRDQIDSTVSAAVDSHEDAYNHNLID